MDKLETQNNYKEISLEELFLCLWAKFWIIVLVAFVFGLTSFLISSYALPAQYESYVSMYVNNKSDTSSTFTQSDMNAAKSLVDTYITIIESDSVLSDVIKEARLSMTTKELRDSISASSVNATEVFKVSIKGTDPHLCAKIANTISSVAPKTIKNIVEGSSVKIVDSAKVSDVPVSPSIPKNVAIACILGILLSSVVIVMIHMFDKTINTEEDVKSFCTYPVLGIIFDFNQTFYTRNSDGSKLQEVGAKR